MLAKLSVMSDASISELDKILDEWSVSDIKMVLSEIDARLAVIDAIQKLCSDPKTDELHVLHPLVSQARWLFGIEYDNPNYTFNRRLSTVVKEFLDGKINEDTTINWNKRPDLVLASDYSISATCIEEIDDNGITYVDRILIIELKKGGFKIGRKEMSQQQDTINRLNHQMKEMEKKHQKEMKKLQEETDEKLSSMRSSANSKISSLETDLWLRR